MKLTIATKDLAAALGRIKRICAAASTLPILGSVAIRAEGGKLRLSGTNLDHFLELTIPAQIDKPGAVAVVSAKLAASIGKMQGENVTLSTDKKNRLTCKSDGMESMLLGLPIEEVPPFPAEDAVLPSIQLAGDLLASGLNRTVLFASEDSSRYVLNGVCLHAAPGGKLAMAATDGKRLAVAVVDESMPVPEVIVPTLACKILAELAGGLPVRLAFGASILFASTPGWTFAAKRLEGNYPNFAQVIPPAELTKIRVKMDRAALHKALPFVQVMAASNGSVRLETADSEVSVHTATPDLGESTAVLPAVITGGSVCVAYNPAFLADVLSVCREAEITLAMADNASPTRIDELGFIVVLMPMRLGEGKAE